MARTDIKVKRSGITPSAKTLGEYLDSNNIDHYFVVADAKRDCWQNNETTLVLRQSRLGSGWNVPFALGNLPWKFQADEFSTIKEDGDTFYRIWWD